MNLTTACVLIAWYSQEKCVCLLISTWYLLSPSPMSVYLPTCIFCRWFGYNLLAGIRSFPVQPVLQQLSHMAGVLSSRILVLVDSSSSEVTGLCLCYVIMQLCCFEAKLLTGKRRPSQAFSHMPSLPGNRSFWWKVVGTRFLLRVGIMRKQESHCPSDICWKSCESTVLYPKTWFCFIYLLKKCGVGGF